jgi:putative membrane protein
MKFATIALMTAFGITSTAAVAQQTDPSSSRRSGQSTMERAMDRTESRTDDHARSGKQISAKEFSKKAGASGAAEVEMGKLGAQKATDPEVKAYAQKMVTHHSQANKELMAAARSKGLEVPTDPDLLHKGMKEKFERQKADDDFNHDFMQQMVRDHKAAVELYETAANDTTLDPEFRALARKTLPTLKEHLADAERLEARLDKDD